MSTIDGAKRDVVPVLAGFLDVDGDELLGVRIGERPQQRRVDDAEERGGHADAERERQPGQDGEGRLMAQLAQRVLHVLKDRLHHASASDVVAAVLNHRDVAEAAQCRLPCRGRIEALARVLVGPHRHVKVQLLADFIRRAVAPEQRAESRERDPEGEHWRS